VEDCRQNSDSVLLLDTSRSSSASDLQVMMGYLISHVMAGYSVYHQQLTTRDEVQYILGYHGWPAWAATVFLTYIELINVIMLLTV
jgi:hypothetical protein